MAEKIGVSSRRLLQMEAGDVPSAWLYLRRLRDDGVDLNTLLTAKGNGR